MTHKSSLLWLMRALLSALLCTKMVFAQTPNSGKRMELKRPVRSWEFVDAVGRKAALFGNENGRLEVWVYPMKLFRDFTLRFHWKDRTLPGQDLAREVIVHPEDTAIVYATASWTVRETLFVPLDEPALLIRLDVDSFEPLQIEAQFVRDFQLMWPASIGGSFMDWNKKLSAFVMGHEEKKYAGIFGSPAAVAHQTEFLSNASSSDVSSLLLSTVSPGHTTQYIYVAASVHGAADAEAQYQRLIADSQQMQEAAAQFYQTFLNRTLSLNLPDSDLQSAYDWSRISMIQGLVENPFLGLGLIAGYRGSAFTQRPGFDWFFGRDSLWSDFAFDSIGDFPTARAALEFIMRYQRKDGKVEHEVSQTATLVPWFKDFVYPYASADATPLLILATRDYVRSSGDVAFLARYWDNIWRAYQFLKSTYNSSSLPRNKGVGHGWVEGGPLLPVESEIYQSGLAAAALAALAELGSLAGKPEVEQQLRSEYEKQKKIINEIFWSESQNSLIFGVNEKNDKNDKLERIEVPTVLSTAPLWFEVFDPGRVNATIDHLSTSDQVTDWGMRILSNANPLFDPSGYHFGGVWPLFTGWASLGEYIYHRPLQAYANLKSNANLVFDGSLGHVTEVLSGSYYEPLSDSSPHQIWSSAMVVTPLVRGLLGITSSATQNEIVVSPHVPAGWPSWSAANLPACGGTADLEYRKTSGTESLGVIWHKPDSAAQHTCTVTFSPHISLHAKVAKGIKVMQTLTDQHPTVSASLVSGRVLLRIPVKDDFQLTIPYDPPSFGDRSKGLRVIHENWTADRKHLQLELQGISGKTYAIQFFGALPISVDGARVVKTSPGSQQIEVTFRGDAAPGTYTNSIVTLEFGK